MKIFNHFRTCYERLIGMRFDHFGIKVTYRCSIHQHTTVYYLNAERWK